MQPFVSSYGLDFPQFQALMKTTNSLFAGSAALSLYLKEHDVDTSYVPSDMDIFMEDTHSIFQENGHWNQKSNVARFTPFLLKHGYNVKCDQDSKEYYSSIKQIKQIISFCRGSHIIQLIVVMQKDLIRYIKTHFDLSICATWWNAHTNTFETLSPESTLKSEMHIIPGEHRYSDNLRPRIQKYKDRGFCLTDAPYVVAKDHRLELDNMNCRLKDVAAFDMWSLEDVKAVDFLKESSQHILIKAGAQFYAFDRQNLIPFMKSRCSILPGIGEVYDTPHNQTIIKYAFVILPYLDHSIFELRTEYNITHGSKEKTMCALDCYTVHSWNNATPSAIFSPPFKDSILMEMIPDDTEVQPIELFPGDVDIEMMAAIQYFRANDIPDFYEQEALLADIRTIHDAQSN